MADVSCLFCALVKQNSLVELGVSKFHGGILMVLCRVK